ncbi:unnamed protein product [Cunninghamella blakesleeana]
MSLWTKYFSWVGKGLSKPSTTTKEVYNNHSTTKDIYNTWSKQQLIDCILLLEHKTTKKIPFQSTSSSSSSNILNNPLIKKERKKFDMSKYPQQKIAFKVAYLGWNYLGFASQKEPNQVTVESELFKAFKKCQLITDPDDCDFSRCGRTDKGVSGLGQVISLNVRQNKENQKPIPYVETLNSLLPKDIRIIAWANVPTNFNARFDCLSRTYKYMFLKNQDLDIDKMKLAASYLIGTHDFRNFCKVDPSKQLSYERTILSLDIQPVHHYHHYHHHHLDNPCYEIVLKGTAFLWHQVRCIMSILFLVGQQLESPTIIHHLLDVNNVVSKPDYPLASDLPLLLYDCEFKDLDWQYGNRPYRLEQHWYDLSYDQFVRSWLYQSFLNDIKLMHHQQQQQQQQQDNDKLIHSQKNGNQAITVVLGGGKHIRTTKYHPLLTRPRADSEQLKREKYHAKLQQ